MLLLHSQLQGVDWPHAAAPTSPPAARAHASPGATQALLHASSPRWRLGAGQLLQHGDQLRALLVRA